jgi:hypothetical protein
LRVLKGGGVNYDPIEKVILFGGAPLLVATAVWLKSEGIETRIYTAPRQVREPMNASGITFGACLDQEGLPFVSTTDINAEPTIRPEITSATIGIGLGEAWSFDANIIDAFGGKLLDFMGIPHPRYRGGAHYSWMIMSNARIGGCNLQIVNTEMAQGVFDSGAIVKSASYEFPATARIPQDYFDAAIPNELALIREFIGEARQGRKFVPANIDESKSLYFTRLNT